MGSNVPPYKNRIKVALWGISRVPPVARDSRRFPGDYTLTCTADTQSFLLYVNYSPNKLNNFTFRTEFFMDPQGRCSGVVNDYTDGTFAWQHWFSPQIELRF